MSFLSLMASLGLNATGFESGLKRVQSLSHHVGGEISSELKGKLATAFGGAAIEEAFRRTSEYAHKLKDLNLRTGLSTDELQAFDFAAQRAGTSLESVITAIEKLGIAQAKSLGPQGAETFSALQRLGLSPEQIRNMEAGAENFKIIGETIKNADSSNWGQMLKDMTEAFGRSSRELIPMFVDGLDEAAKRLTEINGRLNPEQIDQMAEATDRWKEILRKSCPSSEGFHWASPSYGKRRVNGSPT